MKPENTHEMYEEVRALFGLSASREGLQGEPQKEDWSESLLGRALFYGSAAVIGILLRLLIVSHFS